MPGAPIAKLELWSRLGAGHAAGVTVVTPNRRLAQELDREFDRCQLAKGLKIWEDADILPFAAFAERLYEDALYSEHAPGLPLLLTEAQELAQWEAVIAASGIGLLHPAQAAEQCAEAWSLAHRWRVDGVLGKFPGNEDAEAFAAWSRAYRERCAGDTDHARLPDLVAGLLEEDSVRKPGLLVAYGFDIVPPQTREFFERCEGAGVEVRTCGPTPVASDAVRAAFGSSREELEAAARWARARLEAGAARIGVVLPDLLRRRREVVRTFASVLWPRWNLPGAAPAPMPFNLSAGAPLSEYSIVDAALGILELSFGVVEFPRVSRLVRSPFLGGAESEMAARTRLDAALRQRLPARLTLPRLIGAAQACPALRSVLETLFAAANSGPAQVRSPRDWVRHFTVLLQAARFPGDRTLDSDEFQARARFFELLHEFAGLDRVTGTLPIGQAFAMLRRACASSLFQPESIDAPVQVLGILESAGLEFDHLWVSGLTEEAWPLPVRHNPFVPLALQRRAGIPHASAESSLALDRSITGGWMRAAPEVVLSHPLKEEDRDLLPSPLISSVQVGTPPMPAIEDYRRVLFASARTECLTDEVAPPIAAGRTQGGTRVLADQAACPFRAFARHRLGAEALGQPAPSPGAAERGRLIHSLMAGIWRELGTRAALSGNLGAIIERAAATAVKDAGLEDGLAELERVRLAKLAREWLSVEEGRDDFEVVAVERKLAIEIAGLSLEGRIDRMDRLADGSHALIDYKTGRPSPNEWLGERPDEPQLPLYALAATEEIGAVAFARVRAGEMRYLGLSHDRGAIPNVRQARSWPALFQSWRAEIGSLARGFASGEARVDPKRGLQTCRNCGLQPLCRVHERIAALGADAE